MTRFVVLWHELPADSGRESHWDFMLETPDALETWALAEEPSVGSCLAERLSDHRKAYLDYEGEVSGGRGSVTRWDAGNYVRLAADDRHLTVVLAGGRLRGIARLQPDESAQRWRFSFEEGAEAIGRAGEPSPSDLSDSRGTV